MPFTGISTLCNGEVDDVYREATSFGPAVQPALGGCLEDVHGLCLGGNSRLTQESTQLFDHVFPLQSICISYLTRPCSFTGELERAKERVKGGHDEYFIVDIG